MENEKYKSTVAYLLSLAGIEINGPNPWDIQIHNNNFYKRVLTERELGFGEAYMDGWWDCEKTDELIFKILRANILEKIKYNYKVALQLLGFKLFNLQSKKKAYEVGEHHYDLGNDLFVNMLDKRMTYSCAYWKDASTLDEAQENKLELICKKLYLEPAMKVLDIGCGWGSFAKYAAEKYGVEVTGITVSKEQVKLGKELCKGLPVEFRLQDYRTLNEKYDRIVSVGMIEHVGYKNYKEYFKTAEKCLTEDGIFLLHTIGHGKSVTSTDPWTHKYIFPNGMHPSLRQLSKAIEGLFIVEDLQNIGTDYDKTLMAWYKNFKTNWNKIKHLYDDRFYKMWEYFLLSSAGSFRARHNQVWQIVLTKRGLLGGYNSFR